MKERHTWSHHYRRWGGRRKADVADLACSCSWALCKVDPPVCEVEIQCYWSTRHIDDREGECVVLRIKSQAAHCALCSVDEVIIPRHYTALVICCKISKGATAFFCLGTCVWTWQGKAEVGAVSIVLHARVVVKVLGTGGLRLLVKDSNIPQHIDVVSNDRRCLCASWLFARLEHLLEVSVYPNNTTLKYCDSIRSWVAAAIPDYLCLPSSGVDSSNHIQRVVYPVDIASLPVQSKASWSDNPWRH